MPEFYYAFGPSLDGVIIDTDMDTDPEAYVRRLSSFDILYGVTSRDGFIQLSESDLSEGITRDKMNAIIRTFVRNTYK